MDIIDTREEIIRRSNAYIRKRARQRLRAMEAVSAALAILLLAVIGHLNGGKAMLASGNYGSMLLGEEAGAYILIGLICFVLGVLITLISLKKKDISNTENIKEEELEGKE